MRDAEAEQCLLCSCVSVLAMTGSETHETRDETRPEGSQRREREEKRRGSQFVWGARCERGQFWARTT